MRRDYLEDNYKQYESQPEVIPLQYHFRRFSGSKKENQGIPDTRLFWYRERKAKKNCRDFENNWSGSKSDCGIQTIVHNNNVSGRLSDEQCEASVMKRIQSSLEVKRIASGKRLKYRKGRLNMHDRSLSGSEIICWGWICSLCTIEAICAESVSDCHVRKIHLTYTAGSDLFGTMNG